MFLGTQRCLWKSCIRWAAATIAVEKILAFPWYWQFSCTITMSLFSSTCPPRHIVIDLSYELVCGRRSKRVGVYLLLFVYHFFCGLFWNYPDVPLSFTSFDGHVIASHRCSGFYDCPCVFSIKKFMTICTVAWNLCASSKKNLALWRSLVILQCASLCSNLQLQTFLPRIIEPLKSNLLFYAISRNDE